MLEKSKIGILLILILFSLKLWGEDDKNVFMIESPFVEHCNFGQYCVRGDYDGDGEPEMVIVGSKNYIGDRKYTARFVVYDMGGDWRIRKSFSSEIVSFSSGIFSIISGDFNGDGFDDLVYGCDAVGESNLERGFVTFIPGSSLGLQPRNRIIRHGYTNYGSFGGRLLANDFNNDGITDLAVQARYDYFFEGRIYLFYGAKNFSLKTIDLEIGVPDSQSLYLVQTGDFNKDGNMDILCRTNPNWRGDRCVYCFFENIYLRESQSTRFENVGMFYSNMTNTFQNNVIGINYSEDNNSHLCFFNTKTLSINNKPNLITGKSFKVHISDNNVLIDDFDEDYLVMNTYCFDQYLVHIERRNIDLSEALQVSKKVSYLGRLTEDAFWFKTIREDKEVVIIVR